MKKIFAVLLCAIATSAFASDTYWVRVGKEPATAVYYVDVNSIRAEGEFTMAWVLLDFPESKPRGQKKSGKTSGSMRLLQYFDCAAQKLGTAQVAFYAENMGRGRSRHATRRDMNPEFGFALKGSPEQQNLDFVCARVPQSEPQASQLPDNTTPVQSSGSKTGDI